MTMLTKANTHHIRLQYELALARLNFLPLAALLLSVLLSTICFLLLPQLAQMEVKERAIRQQLQRHPVVAAPVSQDPLLAFRSVLVSAAGKNAFLRDLSQQANQAGLTTARIDFRVDQTDSTDVARLGIVIPVTGSYPLLQGFAFDLLAKYPALALERIELRREQAEQATLNAQLHFVLFMEPSP